MGRARADSSCATLEPAVPFQSALADQQNRGIAQRRAIDQSLHVAHRARLSQNASFRIVEPLDANRRLASHLPICDGGVERARKVTTLARSPRKRPGAEREPRPQQSNDWDSPRTRRDVRASRAELFQTLAVVVHEVQVRHHHVDTSARADFVGLRPAGGRQDLVSRRESLPDLALGGFVVDDDEQSTSEALNIITLLGSTTVYAPAA